MTRWIRIPLITIALMGGCREQPGDLYVEITGRIFVFNVRIAEASYLVTMRALKQIPMGASVVGTFENPDGGEPIVVEQVIWPHRDKIVLESSALRCVKKDRPYPFKLKILGPNSEILQALSGVITSSVDQSILPDRPLVVGPAYEPNPELKGHPDGKILWPRKASCP